MRGLCNEGGLPPRQPRICCFFARGSVRPNPLGCSTAQWPADGRRRHGNVQRPVGGAGGGRGEGAPERRWIQGRAASDREAKLSARLVRAKEHGRNGAYKPVPAGAAAAAAAAAAMRAFLGRPMHCVARLGLFCANAPARRLRVRAYGRHGPWSVWDHARIPPQHMGAASGACWPTLRAWHARHSSQPTAGLDPPTAARITGRVPAPVRPAEPPPRRRSRRAPCRECRRACSPPASSRSRAP